MLALVVVAAALLFVTLVGEAFEARSQCRRCPAGRLADRGYSAPPEPLIPSTIQRSSGGG